MQAFPETTSRAVRHASYHENVELLVTPVCIPPASTQAHAYL